MGAQIEHGGGYIYRGCLAEEVEAAKARDHRGYETPDKDLNLPRELRP